jgi:hypothetical protein
MERALALVHRGAQFLLQDVHGAVVRHFQVVDARHDRGQIIVRGVWRLAGFAYDCEHGGEVFEAWEYVSEKSEEGSGEGIHTTNRKLGAASDELQEIAALLVREFAHGVEEVAYGFAVEVVAMVGFDGVHESWWKGLILGGRGRYW